MSLTFIKQFGVIGLLSFYFILPVQAQSQTFPVWVANSLERTGMYDSAGSSTSASIYAAKGETESFQIVVKAPGNGLSNVNVFASNLNDGAGHTIYASSYTLYSEHYVNVSQSSVNWNGSNQPMGAGWYPDALIPFNDPNTGAPLSGGDYQAVPFWLNAGSNQPIWVDITVPRTAAAGQYSGTITVTSDSGNVVVPVNLKVWNFALPLVPSQPSSFAYWNYYQVRMDWYQELLKHRVMPLVVSNCLNQVGGGLVGPGCVADRAAEQQLIVNMGLNTSSLRFWSGAQYGNCIAPAAPSVSDIQAALATHQGGLKMYDYSFDEITHCSNLSSMVPVIQQWARNLHQAGVLNYVNMAPNNPALFDDGSGTGRSAIDIWGLLPVAYDSYSSGVSQIRQHGNQIWSYNALVQDSYSPKWLIDFAPINFRVHAGFINESLNIQGLFYWRVDRWAGDVWNDTYNVGVWSPTNNYPGEGTLLYPGDQVGIPGGIVPSMRLKWVRDGMDDYDYVEILKNLGQGAWALSVANSVGPDWTNWTRDNSALYSARNQLGSKIDQLMSNTNAPTVVSATPSQGQGSEKNFQLIVSDSQGAANMRGVHLLMNTAVDGRSACWVFYDVGAQSVSMAWDNIAGWNSYRLGASGTLQNSQCALNVAHSSASLSGNTLTLNLALTFASRFAGVKTMYVDVSDKSGTGSGYQNMGSVSVP